MSSHSGFFSLGHFSSFFVIFYGSRTRHISYIPEIYKATQAGACPGLSANIVGCFGKNRKSKPYLQPLPCGTYINRSSALNCATLIPGTVFLYNDCCLRGSQVPGGGLIHRQQCHDGRRRLRRRRRVGDVQTAQPGDGIGQPGTVTHTLSVSVSI